MAGRHDLSGGGQLSRAELRLIGAVPRFRLGLVAVSMLIGDAATPAAEAPGVLLFDRYCMACHGTDARGIEGLGVNLVDSAYVQERSRDELVEFLKAGRLPDDPESVSNRPMPGFAYLPEEDLAAIAGYLKNPIPAKPR